jgi:hypothetical protein
MEKSSPLMGKKMPQGGRLARAIASLCHNSKQFSAKLFNGSSEHPF